MAGHWLPPPDVDPSTLIWPMLTRTRGGSRTVRRGCPAARISHQASVSTCWCSAQARPWRCSGIWGTNYGMGESKGRSAIGATNDAMRRLARRSGDEATAAPEQTGKPQPPCGLTSARGILRDALPQCAKLDKPGVSLLGLSEPSGLHTISMLAGPAQSVHPLVFGKSPSVTIDVNPNSAVTTGYCHAT